MSGNLGQCTLKRKRRRLDPMQVYDDLPAPLRRWLSEAVLPWSPKSAHRIWYKSQKAGASLEDTLAALKNAEEKTLARDRHSQQ